MTPAFCDDLRAPGSWFCHAKILRFQKSGGFAHGIRWRPVKVTRRGAARREWPDLASAIIFCESGAARVGRVGL
jgi:hypothetical protein